MRPTLKIPEKIVALVHAILTGEFEIAEEKIRPGARLKEDLGLDSLDGIDMVILLEKELGITISDDDIQRSKSMKTLQDLYVFVAELAETPPAARTGT